MIDTMMFRVGPIEVCVPVDMVELAGWHVSRSSEILVAHDQSGLATRRLMRAASEQHVFDDVAHLTGADGCRLLVRVIELTEIESEHARRESARQRVADAELVAAQERAKAEVIRAKANR